MLSYSQLEMFQEQYDVISHGENEYWIQFLSDDLVLVYI